MIAAPSTQETPPSPDLLDAARATYTQALEHLWAANEANTAAWNAFTHGAAPDDHAWRDADAAERTTQTAEREAWFAWRNAWRQRNGWA